MTMNIATAPIVISLKTDMVLFVSGDIIIKATPSTTKMTIRLIKVPSFMIFPPLYSSK